MMSEHGHAKVIEGFAQVYALCGEMRGQLASIRSRMHGAGFVSDEQTNTYARLADLERATGVLLRDYTTWATPLDVSDEQD